MEFSSEEKIIVVDLLQYGRCSIYEFHEKYLLSPAQVYSSIVKLKNLNIIKVDEQYLSLEDNAKQTIYLFRHQIFRRQKPWREIPEDFLDKTDREMTAYLPSFKQVDRRLLVEIGKKEKLGVGE